MIKQTILKLVRGVAGTKRLQNDLTVLKKEERFHFYESRRFQLVEHILHDAESGITTQRYCDHDIIVSLTTYGKRIHDVAFTIESIMQQSMKANKIVLWLDHSFEGHPLPCALQHQQKRGLEIAYCDDLRSYKKLIPSLRRFPEDAIITIDDDLLYDYDIVERLVLAYISEPTSIHCCRTHLMELDEAGNIMPYKDWPKRVTTPGVNNLYFMTTGGGTLFPPHSLDDEVQNEAVFMDICQFADDVWTNAMALKKGTPINKVCTRNPKGDEFLVNESVQDIALYRINTEGEMLNDKQLKAVYSRYNLLDRLK